MERIASLVPGHAWYQHYPTTYPHIDEDIVRRAREAGINRLSIGAQTFDAERLRFLDRAHDAEAVRRAVAAAREAGFEARRSTPRLDEEVDQPFEKTFFTGAPHDGHSVSVSSENDCQISNISPVRSQR